MINFRISAVSSLNSSIACLPILLVLASCGGQYKFDSDVVSQRSHAKAQSELYVDTTKVWAKYALIEICWETTAANFPTEKEWVRDQVLHTWGLESGLTLDGWNDCSSITPSNYTNLIRIGVEDTSQAPHTQDLGNAINQLSNGIVFNFTFANWSHAACSGSKQWCIQNIAVHEFGHALGFSHEQNRSDTPAWCKNDAGPEGANGNYFWGAWDESSVMDYCNPTWNNDGELSAEDTSGVANFYGGAYPIAAVATYWPAPRTDAFERGANNDLIHKWGTGTSWSSESLGGTLLSDPTAASWSNNRLDIVAQGSDSAVWHRWFDGNAWSVWESLGGSIRGTPVLTSPSPSVLDLIVRNAGDGYLYHKRYTSTGWTQFVPLNAIANGVPSVLSSGANQLDVFYQGKDKALWHSRFNGSTWAAPQSWGGTLLSNPVAANLVSGRSDVVYVGTDFGVWQQSGTATTATGTIGISTRGIRPRIAGVSWAAGRLDLVGRSSGDQLIHLLYNGSWQAWELVSGDGTGVYWNDQCQVMVGTPAITSYQPNQLNEFHVSAVASQTKSYSLSGGWTYFSPF